MEELSLSAALSTQISEILLFKLPVPETDTEKEGCCDFSCIRWGEVRQQLFFIEKTLIF